jgi:hypothetical protein
MLKTFDVSFDQFDEWAKKYNITKDQIVCMYFNETTHRFIGVIEEKYYAPEEYGKSLYSYMYSQEDELPPSLRYLNNQPMC